MSLSILAPSRKSPAPLNSRWLFGPKQSRLSFLSSREKSERPKKDRSKAHRRRLSLCPIAPQSDPSSAPRPCDRPRTSSHGPGYALQDWQHARLRRGAQADASACAQRTHPSWRHSPFQRYGVRCSSKTQSYVPVSVSGCDLRIVRAPTRTEIQIE